MKIWLIYLTSIAIVFGASLQFGFFQDDYFHLLISRADSIQDVIQFFIPRPDSWVFFRPLSTQLYYYTFTSIFGLALSPLIMHIFMLLLHTTNAYLVRSVVTRLKGFTTQTATLIGLLYGISGIHFMSLFYIGATQQLLAMFFSLFSLIFLLRKKTLSHLLMLIFALLSKELSIRIPVFIFFYLLLTRTSLKASLKRTLPSTLVVIGYLLLRFILGVTTPSEYAFVISPLTTIATLMWYFLMSLGLPEHILNFGLSGGIVDFASFLRSTGILGWLSLTSFLGIFSLFAISIFRSTRLNLIIFSGIWLSSIFPVLFLPTHRYAHYLDLSVMAIFIFMATYLGKKTRYLLLGLGVVLSITSVSIDYSTHWTVARANIASHLTSRIEQDHACLYPTWYLTGSKYVIQEVEYAVLWDNFLPITCSNPIALVYNEPIGSDYYLLDLSESDLLLQ